MRKTIITIGMITAMAVINGCAVRPTPPDFATTQKACDTGDMKGCATLGYMYIYGLGVVSDEAKAFKLLTKSCDAGNATGCGELGAMYLKGQGVAKNETKGINLMNQSCDGGDALACTLLGLMYLDGKEGVVKDEAKGNKLLNKGAKGLPAACNSGDIRACETIKLLLKG